MFNDDEPRRKITAHEVGMALDALSIEELQERIGLLKTEITRLEAAISAKEKTRDQARSLFKF